MKQKQKQNKTSKNQKNGNGNGVVASPAAVGYRTNRQPPKVNFSNNGNCVVAHREFVADVYSANSTPLTTPYTINPQEGQVFTWLSALATRFEMYKFRKLKFSYRPSVATTVDGYVVLGMDFDYYDSAPSKIEILAWQHAGKASVFAPIDINVTSSLGKIGPKYCDKSSAPGDLRLSHLGRLWVFTDGGSAVKNLGEIYVEYEIELITPAYKIPPALYGAASTPNFTGPTSVLTVDTVYSGLLDLVPVIAGSGNILRLNTPGKYKVDYVGIGGAWSGPAASIGFTTPTDAPGSDYTVAPEIIRILSATASTASYYLTLDSGSVLLTIFISALSSAANHRVIFSTIKPN